MKENSTDLQKIKRFATWLIPPLFVAMFGLWSILSVENSPLYSYDSYSYASGTESIIESGTYRVYGQTNLHWPPGLPLVISTVSRVMQVDIDRAVIITNAVSFIITVFLTFYIVNRVTSSRLLSWTGLCALILNSAFLAFHDKFWSEPLFFVLALAVIATLLANAVSHSITKLVSLGILVGAAVSVRYAGVFLVPVVIASIAHTEGITWPAIKKSALFCTVLLIYVIGLFLILDASPSQSHPRSMQVHTFSLREYNSLLTLLSDQIIPISKFGVVASAYFLFSFVALPLALLAYAVFTRGLNQEQAHKGVILVGAPIFYITAISASRLFVYSGIPFNIRLFYLLFFLLVISGIWVANTLYTEYRTNVLGFTGQIIFWGVATGLAFAALRAIRFAVYVRII